LRLFHVSATLAGSPSRHSERQKQLQKPDRDVKATKARGLEALHIILKESLKEDNETRKLKLHQLHDLNTLNKFMSDQIGRIADASQKLAAMEKESDDSTTEKVSLTWEKPSTNSLDEDGKVIVVETRRKSHTRNSLGTEMKVAENCLEEIRNKNQMHKRPSSRSTRRPTRR
jgi:hypothetical protein